MRKVIFGLFLLSFTLAKAQNTGEVMFVGFNADGNDGFSFVTLVDLANGANIRFNDNEWNGSAIGGGGAFNTGEGAMTWNNNTGGVISAGSLVTINNCSTAPVATLGTISSGTIALAASNEVLYMFLGSDASTPTTFLSAIANNGFSVANGQLSNTGLTAGVNAISIIGDEDVMVYLNNTNCNTTVANCAASIANTANWATQDGVGDQSIDGTFPDFPTHVCDVAGTLFYPLTTYYSLASGAWDANTSWSLSSDGSTGAVAAGVWPRRTDNVVIRSTHTITVNAVNDNKSCGLSPDGLLLGNVGPFISSNVAMFYQAGDITISGTLTVTGIEMMVGGYTHILSTGAFNLSSYLVNVGYLEADAASTLSTLDDFVISGNSTTIINTNSTSADDIIIDHTNATLCGTGTATLQNGAGSVISYTNSATVAQICTSFTINCTGGGCSGFPVVGTNATINGNTGPAGVGNLTNNKLWLMANRGTFSDNGVTPTANLATVQRWNDQSGNNNNALQNTAGNRPIYRTGQANNLPALEFTGNLFIDGPTLGIVGTGGFTYLMVFRDTQTGLGAINDGSGHFILDRTTATNDLVSLKPVTGSFYAFQKRDNGGGGLGGPISTTAINTNSKWIEMVRNRGTNYRLYYNGTQESSVADVNGNLIPPIPRIGRHATTANGGLRGFINEFFIYSSVLNNAQRVLINNYVSAKYAITLGVDDLYTMDTPANGDYDFDVAGVGQASDGSSHKDAKGTGVVRMWNPNNLANGEFLIWGHNNLNFSGGNTDVDGVIIQERITRVWRVSEVGDVGSVSLSVDLSGTLGSALGNNLRLLIDRDGDGFADNDVTPAAGSFSGTVVTFSGVNFQNGDRFTIGNTDISAPLPVELISFSARALSSSVQLNWETASELNNDFFTIERSQNAEVWDDLIIIKGAGTTSLPSQYQFKDTQPVAGISFYRLKQTDFDGKYEFSKIVSVKFEGIKDLIISPNPSSGLFTIANRQLESRQIRLFNSLGQAFEVDSAIDNSDTLINISSFPSGMYILQIVEGNSIRSLRIVKN